MTDWILPFQCEERCAVTSLLMYCCCVCLFSNYFSPQHYCNAKWLMVEGLCGIFCSIWPCICINHQHHISWPERHFICMCVFGSVSLICLLDGQSQHRTNFVHQINGARHQKGQNRSFNRFIWAIANFAQNDKSRAFVLGKYLILFIIHIQIRHIVCRYLCDMRALL